MKKLIFLMLIVFISAGEINASLQKFATSKQFQEYLNEKIKSYESKIIKSYPQKYKEVSKLFALLEKNADNMPIQMVAKNFVKINNLITHFWMGNTYANGVKLDGKNIIFEFFIKDNEKMRKKFKDEYFKKSFKYTLDKICNKRICHHDKILELLLKNGYNVIYRYKFYSNKKHILDVVINQKTCNIY